MSDRESILHDHINDLLAREREWLDQYKWRECAVCGVGCDPENAVSCEAPGCEAVMHEECAVPLDEDTFLCPKHAAEITARLSAGLSA